MQFPRTFADFGDTLSEAEREVIEKTCAGEACILGDGSRPEGASAERDVRASVIRYLALGGCAEKRVHEKGIELDGANIIGALDLIGCRNVCVLGLFNCRIEEGIEARDTGIAAVYLRGSSIKGLNLQGAQVKGDVFLSDEFSAKGGVSLSGAKIGGQLGCDGSDFLNEGGFALNAQSAQINGDVFLRGGFSAEGEVRLSSAEIGGQLDCSEGSFSNEGGFALNAHSALIKGGVFLSDGFSAKGEVTLSGAEIGGFLSCIKGSFSNEGGDALNVHSVQIKGGVFLMEGFSAEGEVSFAGAEIGGQLSCIEGSFSNEGGYALTLQGAIIKDIFFLLDISEFSGRINLVRAHAERLKDDVQSWRDAPIELDGFTYGTLGASLSVDDRLDWLAKNNPYGADFQPQPYQQLAKVYGEMGHRRDRGAVLMEMETRLRAWQIPKMWESDHTPWGAVEVSFHWLFGNMSNLMVGYGHRPARSLIWAVGLIGLTWLFAWMAWGDGDFAPASPHVLVSEPWQALAKPEAEGGVVNPAQVWSARSAEGRDYETFLSFAYAADVFIPLVNFGQEDAWSPSTTRGWWGWHLWWLKWVVKALGWIITAMGAAAITGVIRSD